MKPQNTTEDSDAQSAVNKKKGKKNKGKK